MNRRAGGALGAEVLARLSLAGAPLSPAELVAGIGGELAYSTVTTILTRLRRKGLVTRHRQGRHFAYELSVKEADVVSARMHRHLRASGDRAGVRQRFVSELTDEEAVAVRHLLEELDGAR